MSTQHNKKLQIAIDFMKRFCKRNGLKLRFSRSDGPHAGEVTHNWTVLINSRLKNNITKMLSVFFHEMSHIECVDNGLFPAIHTGLRANASKNSIEKRRLDSMRTIVRAEKFVDNRAAELMREYFPFLKFSPQNPKNRSEYWTYYRKVLDSHYKKMIKNKRKQ